MKRVTVQTIDTGTYVLNEDNEFTCTHEKVTVTKDSDGVYATCDNCDSDLSETFDWYAHYINKEEARQNL